jgi:hypothetical protein
MIMGIYYCFEYIAAVAVVFESSSDPPSAHDSVIMGVIANTQLIRQLGSGDGRNLGAEDAMLTDLLLRMDPSGKARADELPIAATRGEAIRFL